MPRVDSMTFLLLPPLAAGTRFATLMAWGLLLCPVWRGHGQEINAGSPPPAMAAKGGGLRTDLLIPAAFGIRTDREGNSWSVEPDGNLGRIGSTMVNSGLALLVNEEKFAGYQPMMSGDGNELIFQGLPLASSPGLQVQRRVLLVERSGGLRYAELFYNGSTDAMSVTVGLVTNFSGNYKTFVSNRGRTEPVILSKPETGIFVLPGSSPSTRAFLFTLADDSAAVKPTISAQNRYGLTFRYQINLKPGETGVVVHHVTQVVIPQNFDRVTLGNLSRPHGLKTIRDSFSSDWSDYIVNYRAGSGESRTDALLRGGINSLGVQGGATDILAIGEKTRLFGKAEGGPIHLKCDYGEAEMGLDLVGAIVGHGTTPERHSRLFLKDGQIFTAVIEAPGLAFVPSGGVRINLAPESIDRLVMAKNDEVKDWTADSLALIETHRGDRIKVRDLAAFALNLATPWGVLPISLDSLAGLRPADEGAPGFWVELKDGTAIYGFLADKTVSLGITDVGGLTLKAAELKSIFTPEGSTAKTGSKGAQVETVTRVLGNQALVGPITNTTIPIMSSGSRLEAAMSEIRRIRRVGEAGSTSSGSAIETTIFEIERWDGGVISGYLNLDFVSVEVEGRTWQVPIRDIQEIETASPLLTPEILRQIQALINNLGADNWVTREEATRDLGAFGYLARPVLQRELGSVKDAEIGRRIERLLADLH
ncbi:MAG TPA: hypothetical protein PK529_06875 [Verrucomicrobiales bacterium]|nr:hypothetical protein [Verrucomicrobiales bacterium]